ncbi:helix-turn-helix domain-containing protein, partial [Escherichia coli]
WLMMSLWDALRMNMMISYQELVRTFLKKDKITDREMEIIRMTAQGMLPKSIARIENCSVKTVYTHRRNAEAKLYSKLYKLVQ